MMMDYFVVVLCHNQLVYICSSHVFYIYLTDRKCCTFGFRVASKHEDYEALNFCMEGGKISQVEESMLFTDILCGSMDIIALQSMKA